MALEKLDIISVNYTDKKKDGSSIVTKFGKPSYKTGIKTKQYEGYLNGFLPFPADKWENTQQELEIWQDEKWGMSFKLPPKGGFAPRPAGAPPVSGGMSLEQFTKLFTEVYAIRTGQQLLIQLLQDQGVIPKKQEVVRGVEYPTGGSLGQAMQAMSSNLSNPPKPVSKDDFDFTEETPQGF